MQVAYDHTINSKRERERVVVVVCRDIYVCVCLLQNKYNINFAEKAKN